MMILLLMLGIKLDMEPLYFLIWFVVFAWRLCDYWGGADG
jgi:hypothetical protein